MKFFLLVLFLSFSNLLSLSNFPSVSNSLFAQEKSIQWEEDFSLAALRAEKEKKPLLLLFTGSDWCKWCKKIESEIFLDPQFQKLVEKEFVFFKADFPKYRKISPEKERQNYNLHDQYRVRGFPTVILLDPKQKLILRTGHLDISAKEYAEKLLQAYQEFLSIEKTLSLDKNRSQEKILQDLYKRAQILENLDLQEKIFSYGLAIDGGSFFRMEKYRKLLSEGKIYERETKLLRSEIEQLDPHNLQNLPYQLALLDFEALKEKTFKNPEELIVPLIEYIQNYGKEDKNNLWRIEMMVAQVFFLHDKIPEALSHARAAYKAAPEPLRKEIFDSIHYMKQKKSKTTSSKKSFS